MIEWPGPFPVRASVDRRPQPASITKWMNNGMSACDCVVTALK